MNFVGKEVEWVVGYISRSLREVLGGLELVVVFKVMGLDDFIKGESRWRKERNKMF